LPRDAPGIPGPEGKTASRSNQPSWPCSTPRAPKPAEHNVGHQYRAEPALEDFYRRLDRPTASTRCRQDLAAEALALGRAVAGSESVPRHPHPAFHQHPGCGS
jgi:hypothetical protein